MTSLALLVLALTLCLQCGEARDNYQGNEAYLQKHSFRATKLVGLWRARSADAFHCDLPRFEYGKVPPSAGSVRPVIITGWPHPSEQFELDPFLQSFGRHPQFFKDGLVQPMVNSSGFPRVASTAAVTKMLLRASKTMLLFSNNYENPAFMEAVMRNITVPDELKHLDGFTVFAGAAAGSSHPMHNHKESWLGQVTGRKMWWFLPPGTRVRKVNGCQYLESSPVGNTQTQSRLRSMKTCLQRPGEIIWFPTFWQHCTCSIDTWTVGVGAQAGLPTVAIASLGPSPSPNPGGGV